MVKNLIHESLSEKELNCAYIGMVMHVLADMWAHRMFAGIPSYTLNEVGEVYNKDNIKLKFLYVGSDDIEKNICLHTCRTKRKFYCVSGTWPDWTFAGLWLSKIQMLQTYRKIDGKR